MTPLLSAPSQTARKHEVEKSFCPTHYNQHVLNNHIDKHHIVDLDFEEPFEYARAYFIDNFGMRLPRWMWEEQSRVRLVGSKRASSHKRAGSGSNNRQSKKQKANTTTTTTSSSSSNQDIGSGYNLRRRTHVSYYNENE